MEDTNKAYAQDQAFWEKYLKGRPSIPEIAFERTCKYHADHGGHFGVAHDVGAAVGIHSPRLAKYFEHVIVSDIVPDNIELAKERLGTERYSYKAMSMEDADAVAESSVDLVFAATMMHFTNYDRAIGAVAKQLRPGGTFVVLGYGIATLSDKQAQDIWHRLWFEGIRVTIRHAKDRRNRLETFAKSGTGYATMPVGEDYFIPGALRIILNCDGKWPKMVPDDVQEEVDAEFDFQPGKQFQDLSVVGVNKGFVLCGRGLLSVAAMGPNDKIVEEDEAGWSFKTDIEGLRDQWNSFPFEAQEPTAFTSMWKEMEVLLGDGRAVEGVWPAKIILATRR